MTDEVPELKTGDLETEALASFLNHNRWIKSFKGALARLAGASHYWITTKLIKPSICSLFSSFVFRLISLQKIHRALHTTYEDVGKELSGLDEK